MYSSHLPYNFLPSQVPTPPSNPSRIIDVFPALQTGSRQGRVSLQCDGGFGFGAPASHGGRALESEGHIQGLSDPFFSAEGSPLLSIHGDLLLTPNMILSSLGPCMGNLIPS